MAAMKYTVNRYSGKYPVMRRQRRKTARVAVLLAAAFSIVIAGLTLYLAKHSPGLLEALQPVHEASPERQQRSGGANDGEPPGQGISDHAINEFEAQRKALEMDLAEKERECRSISENLHDSRKHLDALHDKIKSRLLALYKYKQMTYVAPLLAAVDLDSALQTGYMMSRVFENDHRLFDEFQNGVMATREIEKELSAREEAAKKIRQQMEEQERGLLAAREQEMKKLTRVTENGQGRSGYDEHAPKSRPVSAQETSGAFDNSPYSGDSFESLQGSLPLPTVGKITATYGTKMRSSYRSFLYNKGVVINAPKGQTVQAVFDGTVIFADWLKEYGKVMIVDHGDHYYSLIAHADEFAKRVGDSVRTGEVVATVGNTGSPDGAKLYFEIRHHGRPVDPMEWLAVNKSTKE